MRQLQATYVPPSREPRVGRNEKMKENVSGEGRAHAPGPSLLPPSLSSTSRPRPPRSGSRCQRWTGNASRLPATAHIRCCRHQKGRWKTPRSSSQAHAADTRILQGKPCPPFPPKSAQAVTTTTTTSTFPSHFPPFLPTPSLPLGPGAEGAARPRQSVSRCSRNESGSGFPRGGLHSPSRNDRGDDRRQPLASDISANVGMQEKPPLATSFPDDLLPQRLRSPVSPFPDAGDVEGEGWGRKGSGRARKSVSGGTRTFGSRSPAVRRI